MKRRLALPVGLVLFAVSPVWAATLEVGPGKRYQRIDEANASAKAGDLILVHPRAGQKPYDKEAIFVRVKGLTFRAYDFINIVT